MAQSQIFYGSTISTDDMHNVQVQGPYDPAVYGEYANSWFKHYTIDVHAPAGWTFQGSPWVNFVGPIGGESMQDAQGAFGWNMFPAAHDRFFVIQRNATYIQCTCWAGSHPMQINLACMASNPQLPDVAPHVIHPSKPLSVDEKKKLIEMIRNGEKPLSPEDGGECCDTGMDAPNRYVHCATGDCQSVFGGTVVDDSKCSK